MSSAALYLLMGAADDMATTLFHRDSRLGQAMIRGVGLRGSVVDQFGVLLSGVLRLALVLVGLSLLLSPFGGGGGLGSLFGRLGTFVQGIEIAGIAISPGAILRAVVVLFVGLALVRAFMSWLEGRYLPATDLDGSGRNSVSLVARYVGIALAIIWTLASLGIGMERIALLLSALSVGIGFGLQAITSNFVSGLILLAERPIKIGDWIRVGLDEGDVKRISVRSTEITLPDHSTLIVPNSELITKSVLNKTLSSPLGRIQIQFSVLLGTDVDRVLQIVLDAFAAEPAVLDDPAPVAFVDAILDGRILFNCFAHVGSPRDAYGARSNIFVTLLKQFRDEDIDIGTVPQRLALTPGEPTPFPPTPGTPPTEPK
jgi:potassium efflux system protein